MFLCACGRYFDLIEPGAPIACQECRERAATADPPVIVGRQPAVCCWCGSPFTATRRGQQYCRDAHRKAAWKARAA